MTTQESTPIPDQPILIIEDDPALLRVYQAMLSKAGFGVLAATRGQEGLRLAREALPAVVLLDVGLPDCDGLTVCREIKSDPELASTFVIMVSGQRMDAEDVVTGLEMGADDYLLKPVYRRELIARVHAAIRLKRAEAQAARLAAVIHQVDQATILTDPAGNIVYVNPYFEQMTGYSSEEVLGRSPRIVSSGQHDPTFYADLWRTIASGRTWHGTFHNRSRDGTLFEAEATLFPILSPSGRLINYAALERDVTQRRQLEREKDALITVAAALRPADREQTMMPLALEQLITLFQAKGAAISFIDPDSGELVVQQATGALTALLGVRLTPVARLQHRLIHRGEAVFSNQVLDDFSFALEVEPPDVLALAVAPLIAQGSFVGAIMVGRDTPVDDAETRLLAAVADIAANALHRIRRHEETELHASELARRVAERTQELTLANERLKELDQLKSKFVSDMSHEIRSPVSAIRLYTDLLRQGRGEKHDYYLEALDQSCGRLQELIEDTLTISRLEKTTSQPPDFETVDLNEIVAAAISRYQPRAEARGLELSFCPDRQLSLIDGLPSQLSQLVLNLLANGLNYTTEGSVQVVTSGLNGQEHVCLQVQDSGKGIMETDLPYIFDRFYRGSQADLREVPGSGLGLAIAREVVDLHGGHIEVQSAPHQGTLFRVYLPLKQSRGDETSRPEQKEGSPLRDAGRETVRRGG